MNKKFWVIAAVIVSMSIGANFYFQREINKVDSFAATQEDVKKIPMPSSISGTVYSSGGLTFDFQSDKTVTARTRNGSVLVGAYRVVDDEIWSGFTDGQDSVDVDFKIESVFPLVLWRVRVNGADVETPTKYTE